MSVGENVKVKRFVKLPRKYIYAGAPPTSANMNELKMTGAIEMHTCMCDPELTEKFRAHS